MNITNDLTMQTKIDDHGTVTVVDFTSQGTTLTQGGNTLWLSPDAWEALMEKRNSYVRAVSASGDDRFLPTLEFPKERRTA
jgi:hypothetical protein